MRGNPTPGDFDIIASKFIINLPKQELTEDRIGFHFEKAYFYYLDTFDLKPIFKKYQKPKQLINFCNELLRVCSFIQLPKLTGNQISQFIQENYSLIPVNGVIILNIQETHAILVENQNPSFTKYGFPKGKVNQGENQQQSAQRQVKQQIGISLNLDPNYYVDVEVNSKANGKTLSKSCRFFICKVEESCIVPRKSQNIDKEKSSRQIIHSSFQIRSIGWYRLSDQIPKLIQKQEINTPTKLAYHELMKKIQKTLNYREKRVVNPLQQFEGFDKNYGQIFLK